MGEDAHGCRLLAVEVDGTLLDERSLLPPSGWRCWRRTPCAETIESGGRTGPTASVHPVPERPALAQPGRPRVQQTSPRFLEWNAAHAVKGTGRTLEDAAGGRALR
jgi:hypothetical protein